MNKQLFFIAFIALVLTACSDSGSSGGGMAPPPPANTMDVNLVLDALQVTKGGAAEGSAEADLTIDLDDLGITGSVMLTGVDAESVALKYGFAGEDGPDVVTLEQDTAEQWSIPVNSVLTQEDFDRLNAGGLYLEVVTAANPEGALRGQLLVGNISVYPVLLTAEQEVPPIESDGSATGFVTFDGDSNALVVHVNTLGLDDANMAHVHQAIGGTNGPVLIALTQDPGDLAHWLAEDGSLDSDGLAALNAGELYINVHTPANLPGEVRGQIVPSGVEFTSTRLTAGEVVMGSNSTAFAVAATTVVTDSRSATFHVNTVDLDDAIAAGVNQGPVGQNGPEAVALVRDTTDLFRWSAEDIVLSEAQYAALRNQGLYFTVANPVYPDGAIRGQLIPENSSQGGDDTLQVVSVDPAAGAQLNAFPDDIEITFNRELLASTLDNDAVNLLASGGDGSFGEANDVVINGFAASANSDVVTVDLTGIVVEDDVFQVSLADNQITDLEGAILDGDGDGSPGGQFTSAFTVETPASTATFTFIQENVFTPSCTFSGCHSGATPAAGQNLTAGQAFNNIVGVASIQMPALNRVEPGDPDNSYLVRKIEGTAGTRMPLGRDPLSPELIATIRQWITEGAQNN